MATRASFELDAYVADTLMRDLVGHDRRPSAFLVYLAIAALSGEGARGLSNADLAEMTGLSKRATQSAIAHLARRRLLAIERAGPTDKATFRALRPWRR